MVKFPFSAVAGQNQFKLALILAAINPVIGGVLVSGPRGSAKSTLAKALADILPSLQGLTSPFVSLPLGATEEMLIGTLNLQQVLSEKKVEFQKGLLAKANGGVLYVDEVNLLADNLVDQLLDVASSGLNIIERDGISHSHEAKFILLGTMNPDEGELRSQLQDRFGLCVELNNQYSLDDRIEIVKRRELFDKHPRQFINDYKVEQSQISQQIVNAREIMTRVECSESCRRIIAEQCHASQVDGLRADIVWNQAAKAHAAFQQRTQVTENDLEAVRALVLNHRENNHALSQGKDSTSKKCKNSDNNDHDSQDNKICSQEKQHSFSRPKELPDSTQENLKDSLTNKTSKSTNESHGDWGTMEPQIESMQMTRISSEVNSYKDDSKLFEKESGKKLSCTIMQSKNKKGYSQGSYRSQDLDKKVHWFETLITNRGNWPFNRLRFKTKRTSQLILNIVLLDTSASIVTNQGFAKAKGLILQIAKRAYLKREQITIIGFGNQVVETLLERQRSPKSIQHLLDSIPAVGGTPLIEGLTRVLKLQNQQVLRASNTEFKTFIITDGRVREIPNNVRLKGYVSIVDVEQSTVKRGRVKEIADSLNAKIISLCPQG